MTTRHDGKRRKKAPRHARVRVQAANLICKFASSSEENLALAQPYLQELTASMEQLATSSAPTVRAAALKVLERCRRLDQEPQVRANGGATPGPVPPDGGELDHE